MTQSDLPFSTLFGFSFGRLTEPLDGAVVAFGAPLQSAHPRRPGTESGPAAIRQTSCDLVQTWLSSPSRAAVDLSTGVASRLRDPGGSLDIGDLACGGPVSTASIASIAQTTTAVIDARGLPVLLGGDHRVFEGLVRGIQARLEAPAIISFSDKIALPAASDDEPLPLASLAAACDSDGPLLCVGVNGLQPGQAWELLDNIGGQVVSTDELYENPVKAVTTINNFLGRHPSLVCCIDLECIDSGHAAGTPAINVGGLTPEQLIDLLTQIDLAGSLVGLAVTNVAPALDARGLSELTAAEAMMAALDRRLFDNVVA